MESLFSWEVTGWVVSVGVSIAFGLVASDDFKLAKLFFLISAADAMGGIAMAGTKLALPLWAAGLIVFCAAGAVGFLLLLSFRYVDRKNEIKTGSLEAFSVAAEAILPHDRPSDSPEQSILWTTTQMGTPPAWVRMPISAFVYFRIVNQQSNAVVISELTVEVKTSSGWKKTVIFPGSRLFFVFDSDFKHAHEFDAQLLDVELRGRAIGPKETVRGWLVLFFPTLSSGDYSPEFRFTIGDTLGSKTTADTGKVPVGNFSNPSFMPKGKLDISKYKVTLLQNLPEYWR